MIKLGCAWELLLEKQAKGKLKKVWSRLIDVKRSPIYQEWKKDLGELGKDVKALRPKPKRPMSPEMARARAVDLSPLANLR